MRKIITAALAASALGGATLATTGAASAQPYWGPGYYHHYWGPRPYFYGPRPYYGSYWGPGYYGWRHHWRRGYW